MMSYPLALANAYQSPGVHQVMLWFAVLSPVSSPLYVSLFLALPCGHAGFVFMSLFGNAA